MTTDLNSLLRFQPEARSCARQMGLTLSQRGLTAPLTFYLTERHHLTWLVAVLEVTHLEGRLEGFISQETLHHLSTALRGKLVFLSNSTGLRYMVLLTPVPTLPISVPFPESVDSHTLPLGIGLAGQITLSPPRHLLIGGEPGSGKSNLLEGLLFAAYSQGASLYLADPDGHTFNPDVLNAVSSEPVAQAPQELVTLLDKLDAELLRRQALYRAAAQNGIPPADLDAYNRLAPTPLPRLFLLVDEANSYFDQKNLLEKLTDLARRGRKWGLTMILAGHNWRASDVPRALSTMFPARVSFRVSDDTTGTVVLGSRRWGKQAQHLRQPGRGIFALDGQYVVFQAFQLLSTQMEKISQIHISTPPLTENERLLVIYALEQLEGKFIVNRLAQALAEQGITHHQVQKIAEQFARRGWLTPPLHATDARRITPELVRLVGYSHTGVQAVQGHTTVVRPVQEPPCA